MNKRLIFIQIIILSCILFSSCSNNKINSGSSQNPSPSAAPIATAAVTPTPVLAPTEAPGFNAGKVDMLVLTKPLSDIYNKYSKDKNDELLRGLEPLDVCRLFFYAESIEDYETVYALYIHGENWLIPEKEEFLRQIKNDSVSRDNSKKLLNVLKEDIKDVIISKREPGAYIVMNFDKETFFGKTIGFSMVKSKKGLWKVQFLPLQ